MLLQGGNRVVLNSWMKFTITYLLCLHKLMRMLLWLHLDMIRETEIFCVLFSHD